jgi:hypothetical protein
LFSYKLSGTTVYSKVYATDGVGWTSSIVLSDGVIIDTIPPVQETLYQFNKNLLLNPENYPVIVFNEMMMISAL